MTDEQAKQIADAVKGHGDQLGGNLVYLKDFLRRLQQDEQKFLEEQRGASDRAQEKAHRTAFWSCIAAVAAAVAAIVQAVVGVARL